MNDAVKSFYLLSLLESAPEVASKLKAPSVKDKKSVDVVKEAEWRRCWFCFTDCQPQTTQTTRTAEQETASR